MVSNTIMTKFEDVMSVLVRATITIEALQTVGGFLIMETDRDEFCDEFVEQVIYQCDKQGYQAIGDDDMHETVWFEVPIAHVCYVASVIADLTKTHPEAKLLMPDWHPFVRECKRVVDEATAKLQGKRRYDELGPENMN